MSDTVKLHIAIQIDTEDDDADTGYTLEAWNALAQAERSAIATQMWMDAAGNSDGGGMHVVTTGAEEV